MNRNTKKTLLAVLLCILLLAAIAPAGIADFGGYSGDTDYGGGDYGGSDFGGSDFGSDDYGSGGTYIIGGGSGSGFNAVTVIIVIIVVAYILSRRNKKGSQRRDMPAGAQRTEQPLQPIANYKNLDPNFDNAAMCEKLSNLYVQMQQKWQAKDISAIRPYLSDGFYSQMELQLETMRRQGLTNYVERITVLGVLLRGYYSDGVNDHIIAELRTRIVDYTVKDSTGELVSGSKTAEKFMTYEWELVRTCGKTSGAVGEMTSISCPNCGAPLEINQSAKCPYCGSVVTLSDHDFVLNSIKGISQQTK